MQASSEISQSRYKITLFFIESVDNDNKYLYLSTDICILKMI